MLEQHQFRRIRYLRLQARLFVGMHKKETQADLRHILINLYFFSFKFHQLLPIFNLQIRLRCIYPEKYCKNFEAPVEQRKNKSVGFANFLQSKKICFAWEQGKMLLAKNNLPNKRFELFNIIRCCCCCCRWCHWCTTSCNCQTSSSLLQ